MEGTALATGLVCGLPPPLSTNAAPPPADPPAADPAASLASPAAADVAVQGAPVPAAPAPCRYDTRVGPTPPSPPHPRPFKRASPPKRDPGESSSSRAQEPQSPPVQGPAADFPLDLSTASLIRRPIFHCGPITGNSDCSAKELHNENFYDISDFVALSELRDSMWLVQQYSLEPFITPCQFFYPWVAIEFYHAMTSRQVPHPSVIHFSINGREGTLRASDITATFNLPVILANSSEYRQWPHPSPREMVRLLTRDTTAGSILFQRQLPSSMLLIDHVLRSNLFPLQHLV